MRDFLWEHFLSIVLGGFLLFLTVLLLLFLNILSANQSVEFECLSYGYPQYRRGNPSYCIRHIFDVDEVRTLDELRAKERAK